MTSAGVAVLLQDDLGLSRSELVPSLPGSPASVLQMLAVGDLDGDDCPDVAAARQGSIAVLRGDGCERR